ncbi:MAG: M3 family oligoendopeptidase [Fimbriimonadaceae bacterium]
MASTAARDLTWDLAPIFPSIASPEFESALTEFVADAIALARTIATLTDLDVAKFEAVATELCRVMDDGLLIEAFLDCLLSADSFAAEPQRAAGRFSLGRAELDKAVVAFTAWVGSIDAVALLTISELAREHAYAIAKAQESARRLMGAEAEAVSADLAVSGRIAWAKMYGNVTSQIQVHVDGFADPMPVSAVRGLASHAESKVRANAYTAELAAWKEHAVPIAAALNSIKGASITICRHRGWDSPLDVALFNSNIDRATLDAMLSAAEDAFPMFRRYLRAKAHMLGTPQLAFHDLFAPLADPGDQWSWENAEVFVAHQFDSFSKRMGDLARRAYAKRWIDVSPRPGKRDGAFCQPVRSDESRIMMNFKPSYNQVSTLAHELGHAYHNVCLSARTALQRDTPMTVAETASTFCEVIVRQAALNAVGEAEQLAILEAGLQSATQIVVDISARFRFERAVVEQRAETELTADDFSDIMLDAQRQTYGDGLDPERLHGYMWAAKPHYYGSDFYNFPYMFGMLFGLGLYAEYKAHPKGFVDRYDKLLSRTGMADAATLAADFGIDVRSKAFWQGSLAQISADVDRFCAIAEK